MKNTIFIENQHQAGRGIKLNKGNQPPKNNMTIKLHIIIILQYSARKNNANVKEEYSTLNPLTSSDSASGKSNGNLLVSANMLMKNNRTEVHSGTQ